MKYSTLKHIVLYICGMLFLYSCTSNPAMALSEESVVYKGKISDVSGQSVQGANVYVYSSPDVRKPADFMSSASEESGLFRMVLPPGKYWAVARLKRAEGYGPLMRGDKHSGEPVEIELSAGRETDMDFVVADLGDAIEARKVKARVGEGLVRISGRIIDEKGEPVTHAYAFANINEKLSRIPDYLSVWVDRDGRYTLYIPRGTYYVGGAVSFPMDSDEISWAKMTFDGHRSDVTIVRKLPVAKE